MIFPLNYSSDDYGWSYRSLSTGYPLWAAEGRLFLYFINWTAEQFGASFPFLGAFWPIFASACAVAFGLVLRDIWVKNCPSIVAVTAVLIFSLFPYHCELFIFHIAMPAVAGCLICGAIALKAEIKSFIAFFATAISISLGISYQIFISYFLVAIVFIFLMQTQIHDIESFFEKYRRPFLKIVMLFFGITVFLLSQIITTHFTGHSTTQRAKIAIFHDIPEKAILLIKELYYFFLKEEVMIPQSFKILQIILILLIIWGLFVKMGIRNYQAQKLLRLVFIPGLVLAFAFAATVLPFLALNDYRGVMSMRSLSGISVFWAGTFVFAWLISTQRIRKVVVCIGLLIALVYSIKVNQYSVDFARVNMRERLFANRVFERISERENFQKIRTIIFVGLKEDTFTYGLKTPVVSSMLYPYITVGIMSEISGHPFSIPSKAEIRRAEELSVNIPLWPHPDSVLISGDMAIVAMARNFTMKE